ncbi:hypothetical protein [Mycobacterium kyorinense]|uniref:hypothetical protein n=1 Tax=Mycobacterium kyorinense TaxID=487514 RepID=UPI0012E8B448|nr:hypothetical protein [Mycobacterium kyorinense]
MVDAGCTPGPPGAPGVPLPGAPGVPPPADTGAAGDGVAGGSNGIGAEPLPPEPDDIDGMLTPPPPPVNPPPPPLSTVWPRAPDTPPPVCSTGAEGATGVAPAALAADAAAAAVDAAPADAGNTAGDADPAAAAAAAIPESGLPAAGWVGGPPEPACDCEVSDIPCGAPDAVVGAALCAPPEPGAPIHCEPPVDPEEEPLALVPGEVNIDGRGTAAPGEMPDWPGGGAGAALGPVAPTAP